MRNKLFTASVDKMLFKQYPLGSDLENQKVVAKIFNPYGDGRWYLLNSDPEDPDYIWAIVSMFGNVEIGSVSRSELLGARIRPFGLPLERDLYFSPKNAAEIYRGLLDGKFYEDGGEITKTFQTSRRFTDWDFKRLTEEDFYATWEGGYWSIKKEKDNTEIGKFYPDKELLKTKKDSDIFNWLKENSFLRSDELYFAKGGKMGFEGLSKKVAAHYRGKSVPAKYRPEYGSRYDASEAREVGDKVAAKVYRQQQAKKMADGGIMDDNTAENIQDGFTIAEMNNLLEKLFPYSFSFAVFKPIKGQDILLPDYDEAPSALNGYSDADLKSKLFFPQYKRDHDVNFCINQGMENTYFYFTLNDEKGDFLVGTFGFKDRGDVSPEYVTGFIAFLMQCYGLPFRVKHTAYAKGGGVGEPYDNMTKYELEKELNKINDEVFLLYKKYGNYEAEEIKQKQAEADKIITLLYGVNFSGVGQKFKYAKGGVTDDLIKELNRLQRQLNSPRLNSYMEGDTSAEEMARQAERASKLARFNEILKTLNESNAKFAKGGYITPDEYREKLENMTDEELIKEIRYEEGIDVDSEELENERETYIDELVFKYRQVMGSRGYRYDTGGSIGEMKQLWFVTDNRGAVKNISTSIEAAEVFLASSLKYDGVINYVKVPLKDWESEKVNVGNIRGYASSFWKSYAKGGMTKFVGNSPVKKYPSIEPVTDVVQ